MQMKNTLMLSALIGAGVLTSTPAAAQIGVGVVGGTNGLGLYVGTPVSDRINVRIQGSKWTISESKKIDDINYDVDLDIGAIGAYLDFHPFSNNFRISAGISKSLHELNIENKPVASASFSIGDTPITGSVQAGEIRGKADFNFAPYVGIGWGNIAHKGWGVRFDLGAHFLGRADVDYTLSNRLKTAFRVTEADINKEEQRAEDDIGELIYPEVSLSIHYGW